MSTLGAPLATEIKTLNHNNDVLMLTGLRVRHEILTKIRNGTETRQSAAVARCSVRLLRGPRTTLVYVLRLSRPDLYVTN